MTVRGYQLALDWDRNGVWTGTYDDVTADVNNADVVISWGRDQIDATSRPAAGKLGFGLKNTDRRYSPENAASPIADKVVPGTPARLQLTVDGTIYTLHHGILDTVDADPNAAAKTFTGGSLDAWGLAGGTKLSTPVYQGLRTGDAIGYILDAAGWTGPRDLDPGATVMPFWWAEDEDAAAAVDKLVRSEGPPAAVYVEAGVFVFRDRHHRITRSASTTSQGTYTHIEPAGSGPAGDFKVEKGSFSYDHGLANIANSVSFAVAQRTAGDLAEVWASEDPITLASGETATFFAQASDPFLNAQTPELDVDYTVESGTVTVDVSRTSGQSTILTVTATSDAVVTRLALRASPVAVARTVKVTASDQASISKHGLRTWPEDDVGFANAYDAQAIAHRIVAVYATNRPVVTFTIAHVYGGPIPARYLTQIVQRRLADRVTVRNDALDVNTDFIVERIVHTVRKLGAIHRMELACSVVDPAQPANVFTFNLAGSGFNDGAFGVDGIDNPSTVFRFDVAGQGFNQGFFGN